eukprot:comp18677_c0_seq1/m.20364 comp18677_c0_seq1/g.20364  ORF comp18677_c0_seq1/g.20364 comp18677_c0_seq1/m.20364 type:complete len:108 (-) comp18677_c0_seq1:83-406(-)
MHRGRDLLAAHNRKGMWRRAHLFGAALMVAGKVLMDNTYNLRSWCRLAAVGPEELRHMERAFLALVDYDLSITDTAIREFFSRSMPAVESSGVPQRSKSMRNLQLLM